MDVEPNMVDALQACVAALREAKDELRSSRSANSVQRIVVTNEAKPDAPWMMHAAVTAAVVSTVLAVLTLIGGSMLYLNMKDHLDAIYMMAPSLQHQLITQDSSHAKP